MPLWFTFVTLRAGLSTASTTGCLRCTAAPRIKSAAIPVSVGLTENLVRVGVNYKFNF
jgi:hypothetical protein